MKKIMSFAGVVALLLSPVFAKAVSIDVLNAGFESQALADAAATRWGTTGWTSTVFAAGALDPSTRFYTNEAPEGENVGYVSTAGGYLYQDIAGYTIGSDVTLTLTVEVGYGKTISSTPTYSVELWSGGSLFASSFDSLTRDSFVTTTVTFDVDSSSSLVGQGLRIVLRNTGGGQVNFDNVTLANDPTASSAVPEPSTLLLLGAGFLGLGLARRKKAL